VDAFRGGELIYVGWSFTDPDNDAAGFGFRGAKGSGWGEETHPFSDPSYGIVSNNRVDYPFNHRCGTTSEYESDVEAWIYDAQGHKSQPVITHLSCKTARGGPQGYTFCANEGQRCTFTGTKSVAYGANTSIVNKTADGGIDCNNESFGNPVEPHRVVRSCYIADTQPGGGGGGGGGTGGTQSAYEEGYRSGYQTGFDDARQDCQRNDGGRRNRHAAPSERDRGFADGYDAGFQAGANRYCAGKNTTPAK
jgi:hypothetical protein